MDRSGTQRLELEHDLTVADGVGLSGDHVPVLPRRERRGDSDRLGLGAHVDGDDTATFALESVGVAFVHTGEPWGVAGERAELEHTRDRGPRMDARALAVVVRLGRSGDAVARGVEHAAVGADRRARVAVGERVPGVDDGCAVVISEHERVRDHVQPAVAIGHVGLAALGVVVVDEHERAIGCHVQRPLPVELRVVEDAVRERRRQVARVGELEDLAEPGVLLGNDRLSGAPDDLAHDARALGQCPDDRLDVVGGHVLRGVDAEPGDTERQQVLEVGADRGADLLARRVEIGEVHELARLHLLARVVVLDVVVRGEAAVVEVLVRVQPGVLVVLVRRSRPAHAGRVLAGHVVDDGIRDDVHTHRAAPLDHVGELVARTETRLELVTHRLVRRPPLISLDVLVRRRREHPREAVRTEGRLAFLGDRRPRQLEELHADVGCRRLGRRR